MEIFNALCYRDKRNPIYGNVYGSGYESGPVPRDDCHCPNCESGRDRLACIAIGLLHALRCLVRDIEAVADADEETEEVTAASFGLAVGEIHKLTGEYR